MTPDMRHPPQLPSLQDPPRSLYLLPKEVDRSLRQPGRSGRREPASGRFATLIGLLYCTGLRIGEALKLTLADVNLKGRLFTIRETKFKKSRYVPLSPSAVHHLSAFLRQREEAGFSAVPSAPLFVNPKGRAYGQPRICKVFLEILRNLGLRGPKGERGPRVHDFRHSFADKPAGSLVSTGREHKRQAAVIGDVSRTHLHHRHGDISPSHGGTPGEDEQAVPQPLRHSALEAKKGGSSCRLTSPCPSAVSSRSISSPSED